MKLSTKNMVLASLFAALTAIGAFMSIPIGTVPISMQSFFVILSGMLLGGKVGALSQIIYLLLGLIGLPVFAGGIGGLSIIGRPTFGYILGFILAAYLGGEIVEKGDSLGYFKYFLASIISSLSVYILGLPYLYYMMNFVFHKSLTFAMVAKSGLIIFLPGDAAKAIVVSLLSIKLVPLIKKVVSHN